MSETNDKNSLLELTAQIAAAHLSNSQTAVDDIPHVIRKIYGTLAALGEEGGVLADRPQPAVPVKKSVTPDYIICLEDGRKLKMLRRHLKTAYNLTPEQYRERWGLPPDYPMTAPNYASRRSALAKESGLGTGKKK